MFSQYLSRGIFLSVKKKALIEKCCSSETLFSKEYCFFVRKKSAEKYCLFFQYSVVKGILFFYLSKKSFSRKALFFLSA